MIINYKTKTLAFMTPAAKHFATLNLRCMKSIANFRCLKQEIVLAKNCAIGIRFFFRRNPSAAMNQTLWCLLSVYFT